MNILKLAGNLKLKMNEMSDLLTRLSKAFSFGIISTKSDNMVEVPLSFFHQRSLALSSHDPRFPEKIWDTVSQSVL